MNNVVEKIRKLLELSKSGNEHEAALAAARAQELIFKYEIDEAELRRTGSQTVEEVVEQETFSEGKKPPYWITTLFSCVARSQFCRGYVGGKSLFIVGTFSNRAVFKLMFGYLKTEIDRISKEAWRNLPEWEQENGSQIKFCNSFKAGCVQTVAQRLRQNVAQLTGAAPGAPLESAPNPAALVLKSKNDAIATFLSGMGVRLVKSRGGGRVSDSDGYSAGRIAGHAINLTTRVPARQLGGGGS